LQCGNPQDRQVVGEDELIFLEIGVMCFLEMQAVIILVEVQVRCRSRGTICWKIKDNEVGGGTVLGAGVEAHGLTGGVVLKKNQKQNYMH